MSQPHEQVAMEESAVESEAKLIQIKLKVLTTQTMEGAIYRRLCISYDGVEPRPGSNTPPATGTPATTGSRPQTGDGSNMGLWAARFSVLLAALGAGAWVFIRWRRRAKE